MQALNLPAAFIFLLAACGEGSQVADTQTSVQKVTATKTKNSTQISQVVIPEGPPDAPTDVSATSGDGQMTVSWTPPVSDGGRPVTGYTVTSVPGEVTTTTSDTSVTVSGLTNGTSYTFTVTATNFMGTSASPAPSSAVPAKPPRQGGRPEDKYACAINSDGYCIFSGIPHGAGLKPNTEHIVDRNGAFLFFMHEAVAVNSLGKILQARGTPAFNGDELVKHPKDGMTDDE